jgi:hypothetical protein
LKENQLKTQGRIAKWSGDRAQTAGYIAGASTLFSGVGQAFSPTRSVQMGVSPFARTDPDVFFITAITLSVAFRDS